MIGCGRVVLLYLLPSGGVVLILDGFRVLSVILMISTSALMVVGPGRIGLLLGVIGFAEMVTRIGFIVVVLVVVVVAVVVVSSSGNTRSFNTRKLC